MSDQQEKHIEPARLVASGNPVVHRVEKPWRSARTFKSEADFLALLTTRAELPPSNKIPTIYVLANQNGVPEIARRATLSPLEDEFLALIGVLISSPEKRWIPLLRGFLERHGWRADVRGSPKKHPLELKDRLRGEIIEGIIPRLKRGFDLKTREKKKPGFSSESELIETKLRKLNYTDTEIRAIMKGRKLDSAACYYYWAEHKSEGRPKSVINSYKRFLKMKISDNPK